MDEVVKLNIDRVNQRLKDLVISSSKTQRKLFSKYNIYLGGKKVTLDNIDFKQSLIFVCDMDFLAYISYYGMLKVNNIHFPDTTQSGTYSMIKTSYMIIDSQDIRFSKIPMDAFYQEKRDGLLPDSWNSINYVIKDICLWRLVSSVGIGEDKKMYDGCYSWISERYRNGKIDWIFYIGSMTEFIEEYKNVSLLDIPVYHLIQGEVKEESKKTKQTTSSNVKKLGGKI